MSGLLLPGTAQASDVAAGKTFSGGAGLGVVGTLALPFGLLQLVPANSTTSSTAISFTPIGGTNDFVVCFRNPGQKLTGFAATAGTWTQVATFEPANGSNIYVYRCNGGLTAGTPVTCTATWAAAGYNGDATAMEFPSSLPTFGTPATAFNSSSSTSLTVGPLTPTALLLAVWGNNATNAAVRADTGLWLVSTAPSLQTGVMVQYPVSTSTSLTIYSSASLYNAAVLLAA